MKIPRAIGRTLARLVKQVWRLPQTLSNAMKLRKQRTVLDELEAERLDRIRNPLKYLGK